MSYNDRMLVGMGGWLAFFVVTLGLNALGSFATTAVTLSQLGGLVGTRPGQNWGAYLAIVGLLGSAKVATYGYMAWRLNARQEASTPSLVIKLLWGVVLAPPILDGIAASTLLGLDAGQIGEAAGVQTGRMLIYAGVWTAYLLRSQRVANTYTDTADPELAVVFE